MREPRQGAQALRSLVAIGYYLLHLSLATAGAILIGAFVAVKVVPVAFLPHNVADAAVLGIMAVVGLAAGFVMNSRFREGLAMWVWLPPLLWFTFGLLDSYFWEMPPHTLRSALLQLGFYGANACPGDCVGMLLFTYPLPGAACYSLGAWLALRRRRAPNGATNPGENAPQS